MGGTKPVSEHAWIQQLVGNWKFKSTMMMPDGSSMETEGTEDVEDFGGLWSFGVGKSSMPDGSAMEYKTGLGYDVTFKSYRAFMIMNVSSHLWKYEGTLSEDGKKWFVDTEPSIKKSGDPLWTVNVPVAGPLPTKCWASMYDIITL